MISAFKRVSRKARQPKNEAIKGHQYSGSLSDAKPNASTVCESHAGIYGPVLWANSGHREAPQACLHLVRAKYIPNGSPRKPVAQSRQAHTQRDSFDKALCASNPGCEPFLPSAGQPTWR